MNVPLVEDAPAIAPSTFDLHIPPPKMLTSKEELQMAREAFARNSASLQLRSRLASMLIKADFFDEGIDLLQLHPQPGVEDLHLLAYALLSRETPQDDVLAQQAATEALKRSSTPRERAMVKAIEGKTLTRVGRLSEARECLNAALAYDPTDKDAYKRLFKLSLDESPEQALAFAEAATTDGILHARSLGSLTLALAKLDRMQEARFVEGYDELLLKTVPEPPAGWACLQDFNDALTEELLHHPDMRYERYGTASAKTWRLDEPSLHRSRILPQLQQVVRREIMKHTEKLSGSGHPVMRALPARARLRNWCVLTEGDGYETWHVHQNGWMSGVYYVHVQDHIANGTGPEGCIAFGLPDDVIGPEKAAIFGERIERPHSGLMMMFPSHVYHRTYPHHGSGRRICFAFDVVPEGVD